MANRRFGRQHIPRRKTDWVTAGAIPTGLASVADGASIIFNSAALTDATISQNTIVRIRGMVHLEIAEATLATVLMIYGVGIGLFDDLP